MFTELSCDPLVVEDQFLLVQCPNGYSLGSTCEFACFLSYELRGGMNVTCRKHQYFENKAFWDWQNGNESYCEKLSKCYYVFYVFYSTYNYIQNKWSFLVNISSYIQWKQT